MGLNKLFSVDRLGDGAPTWLGAEGVDEDPSPSSRTSISTGEFAFAGCLLD